MRVFPALLASLALSNAAANVPPPISDDLRGAVPAMQDTLSPAGAAPPPWIVADGNLLQRIASQFSITTPAATAIEQELAWFKRHPDYLDRVFSRGQPYLYYIVGELEKRGMPVELALLPIIESAFDPFAYSHGRAAGLWQIIPGTGRRFGLEQNWWYDGRRDVIAATGAALDYLEVLARMFDGDWLLAIAAYNSGEGNVRKAVRRNQAGGKPIDFFSIRAKLPKETRAYVPRFLALASLIREPQTHGVALPIVSDMPVIVAAATGGQIDLALAAELAGIELATLHRLNPGYNRWATAPAGPHRLVVPVEAAARFREALATLPDNARMRWQRHVVKSGETLSEIAERYRISVKSLRQTNKIRGSTIRIGQALTVPVSSQPLSSYTLTADARQKQTQNKTRRGQRLVHVVRSGDSLWTISRQYGVGVRELARWNAMAPRDTLSAGRELVVWANAAPSQAATPVAAPTEGIQETRRIRYTVRNGDNLSVIAARFRVRVSDLLRWNNALSTTAILRPGQRITVYVDVAQQSS